MPIFGVGRGAAIDPVVTVWSQKIDEARDGVRRVRLLSGQYVAVRVERECH